VDPGGLDRHAVDYAILERHAGDSDAYPAVFPPGAWGLVFFDDASTVVVRRSERNRAYLDAYGLQVLDPAIEVALASYASDPRPLQEIEADPARARTLAKELARSLRFHGNRSLADYLGYLVLRADSSGAPTPLADVEGALERNPGSAYLWLALGRMAQRAGRDADARSAYQRARALDEALFQSFMAYLQAAERRR
jgi:hypothetical protein